MAQYLLTKTKLKNRTILIYTLLVGKSLSFATGIYFLITNYFSHVGLLSRTKIHLSFQILLALIAIAGLYRLIKMEGATTKMRKQAGEQKLALSKSVEVLLFLLMINVIFNSLFMTFSPGRYVLSTWESTLYVANLILQFIVIASLVNGEQRAHKSVAKLDHRYSIVGAVFGLIGYFIYYQMIS